MDNNPFGTQKDRFTGFRWRVGSWGPPVKLQNFHNWLFLTKRYFLLNVDPGPGSCENIYYNSVSPEHPNNRNKIDALISLVSDFDIFT